MSGRVPRVTVGVPVFNGEKYVAQSLRSLVEQDFEDFELLISDNASTDGTEEICRAFAEEDKRIRYERQDRNRGGQWNVNHLVHVARGREFKWAYSDDVCAPTFLSSCTAALDEAGAGAVMAHTRVLTIDKDSRVIEERDDAKVPLDLPTPHQRLYWLLRKLVNQAEFGLMRTSALRSTGLVQPFIGSELVFLCEMVLQGRLVQVPEHLLSVRRHDEQFGRDRYSEANWYVDSGRPQSLLPYTKISLHLLRAVSGSRVRTTEKAACAGSVVAGWTVPHWRSAASDVRHLPESIRRRRLLVDGARPR